MAWDFCGHFAPMREAAQHTKEHRTERTERNQATTLCKPCLKRNLTWNILRVNISPFIFWNQCTIFATQIILTDIPAQCYIQETHLKQNDKKSLKIKAKTKIKTLLRLIGKFGKASKYKKTIDELIIFFILILWS